MKHSQRTLPLLLMVLFLCVSRWRLLLHLLAFRFSFSIFHLRFVLRLCRCFSAHSFFSFCSAARKITPSSSSSRFCTRVQEFACSVSPSSSAELHFCSSHPSWDCGAHHHHRHMCRNIVFFVHTIRLIVLVSNSLRNKANAWILHSMHDGGVTRFIVATRMT